MHLIADAVDVDDYGIFAVGIDHAFELADHGRTPNKNAALGRLPRHLSGRTLAYSVTLPWRGRVAPEGRGVGCWPNTRIAAARSLSPPPARFAPDLPPPGAGGESAQCL